MKSCKRLVSILLCCLMLAPLFSVTGKAAQPMEDILGVYEGYYYANQGQTGVTLTVYAEGSAVKAIFDFYNLPNRTNAKEGAFYMDVTCDAGTGEYYFDAGDWIEQPSGYYTVDLRLTLSGNVLSGLVISSIGGTYSFYAEKANDAYAQVQDSIYHDHLYEVVEEGMSWTEAQKYAVTRGGYLATITSADEQAFIERLIANGTKNHYWIGAYRDGDGFSWVTGEPFSYTHWDAGDPNNVGGYENAVHILRLASPTNSRSNAMHWNDATDEDVTSSTEDFFSHSNTGFIVEYNTWSDSSDWATPELETAVEQNLIPDVLIGRDLKTQITRGEFAAVAVKLYEAMTGNRTIIAMDAPFTDIEECAERLYILKAYNYQLVNGTSATTYEPNALITREQLATMLTRVVKKAQWPDYTIAEDGSYPLDYSGVTPFLDDGEISGFAYESVYFMAKNNIINGMSGNIFAPRNTTSAQEAALYANATREQALLISVRTLENLGH